MTNVNATTISTSPLGGVANDGTRTEYLPSTVKAAQNDTITIKNATTVLDASLRNTTTGAVEAYTIANNVITLTSAGSGSVRGTVTFK